MTDPNWPFYAGAGVLGTLGLTVLLLALAVDRVRGKRRCPGCWYDMSGVTGLVCPECGRDGRQERRLHKTRRRWGWALLGMMLMALASVSCMTPRVRRDGWGVLPVWAVLGLESLVGENTIETLSAHRRVLIWRWSPGEWSDFEVAGVFERALRDGGCVRDRWPEGMKLSVSTLHDGRSGESTWVCLPVGWTDGAVQASVPDVEGLQRFATHERFAPEVSRGIEGSERATVVVFEVRAPRASRRAEHIEGDDVRSERVIRFAVPIERVPTVDDAIVPVRNPAVDATIEATLSPRLVIYPESGRVGVAVVQPTLVVPVGAAPGPPMAVGLTITFEREGREVARAHVLTRTNELPGSVTLPSEVTGDVQAVVDADARDQAWKVRISGDGALSLRDFAAERYWAGEFVLSLRDVKR